MAKKPIPGMQQKALSSLASQFPGSPGRDAAGAPEGASSAEAPAPNESADKTSPGPAATPTPAPAPAPVLKPATKADAKSSTGSRPATKSAAGSKPVSKSAENPVAAGKTTAPEATKSPSPTGATNPSSASSSSANAGAPKPNSADRRGTGTGLLWLAVVFCLAAALVSLSAPSLRPVVRDLFTTYVPTVPARYVDFLVGQSRTSVEINTAALDERIIALQSAVDAVAGGAAPDSAEMRTFLTGAIAAGSARTLTDRLVQLETELAAIRQQAGSDATSTVEAREGLATQIAALDTRLASNEQGLAAAAPVQSELQARLSTLEGTAGSAQVRADGLEAKLVAQSEAVEAAKTAAGGLSRAQLDRVRPLLLVMHLRNATASGQSYTTTLESVATTLAAVATTTGVERAKPAIAALRRLEADTIPSRGEVVRNFDEISQSIALGQGASRLENMAASITDWLATTFDRPTSGAPGGDQTMGTLQAMHTALRSGRLEEALELAPSLEVPRLRFQIAAWTAQGRARLAVDGAVTTLEGVALEHMNSGG